MVMMVLLVVMVADILAAVVDALNAFTLIRVWFDCQLMVVLLYTCCFNVGGIDSCGDGSGSSGSVGDELFHFQS